MSQFRTTLLAVSLLMSLSLPALASGLHNVGATDESPRSPAPAPVGHTPGGPATVTRVGAPAPSPALDPSGGPKASPAGATAREAEGYATREASSKQLESFEGGGTSLYLSSGAAAVVIVLLVLLIVF